MALAITFKAFAVWLGILVLAIANGALREAVIIPAIGKSSGLIISGILLSGLLLTVTYYAMSWLGRAPAVSYAVIGFGWLCLTLLFEFIFGSIFQGKSWPELLEAYTFKGGNIWPIVLLVTALAPYVAARIRGWA
ncbi:MULTISPECIES: hypothetical protein [unclassified Synechococcus]|uniref:hypothetical protein n=1 Tax=unclassified Synechococcus TaxID=2626047 RepID=UPI0008FF589F|nr:MULTISPECIES: hypothetical protein [unclassified Synechococcus]MCT0245613.1 hypothetical protein [Synechococcus sp. CS-601]